MKKIFLLAAATAVALSSCSKNEVDLNSTAVNAIGFDNYIGTSTKGSVVNGPSINKNGQEMGVFAYQHVVGATPTGAPNIMNNFEVTTDGTDWTYDNTKYWPTSTDQIDFYAYAPYAAAQTQSTVSGYPVLTLTQSADLATMVDYVYATADNQTKTTNTVVNGQVEFAFKHALSRIAFSAKTDIDYSAAEASKQNGTYINVKKIVATVANDTAVEDNCELTFSHDGTKTIATVGEATASACYAANTAWTIFDYATGVEINSTTAKNFTLLSDTDATDLADATADAPASASKYIFLVPQTIAATSIKVDVTYNIVAYNNGAGVTSSDVVKTAYLPAFKFAQGVAYNFPIVISLDAITFGNVTVDTWGSSETTVK